MDEAAGDLRTMGCSIFYMKCQKVDTVSKLILLGVPNSIEEEVIKYTLDKVLSVLEQDLIRSDSDYKLTVRQKEQWIKYAITKEYPGGMHWVKSYSTAIALHRHPANSHNRGIYTARFAWQYNVPCPLRSS